MSAQTYRKKPVTVEAMQLLASSQNEIVLWIRDSEQGREHGVYVSDDTVVIPTLEGDMTASPGDWIIRGVQGEFYPCKPDIFEQTYELADPPKPKYEVVGPAGRRTKKGGIEIPAKVGDLVRSRYRSDGTVWRIEMIDRAYLHTRSLSSGRAGTQWAADMEIVREVAQ